MKFKGMRFYGADDGGAGAGSGTDDAAAAAAVKAAEEKKAADEKAAADKKAAASVKKEMTQADLDALVGGSKKEGREKLMKKYGFEDETAFDAFIKKAKDAEDASKTAEQKAADALKAKDTEAQSERLRADKAEAKVEALALGVDPARVERFMKLALTYDGTTIKEKVEAAFKENPEFKLEGTGSGKKPNFGGQSKNQSGDKMEEAKAQLDEIFGLKPKA
jgi:hypothetical protein